MAPFDSVSMARKSLSNEFRAANKLIEHINRISRNGTPEASYIRLPMYTLVDYRGRRALFMSRLPIDESTKLIGCRTSGQPENFLCMDAQGLQLLNRIGESLKLELHKIKDCDIELALPAGALNFNSYLSRSLIASHRRRGVTPRL
jgi:hypothetical protein